MSTHSRIVKGQKTMTRSYTFSIRFLLSVKRYVYRRLSNERVVVCIILFQSPFLQLSDFTELNIKTGKTECLFRDSRRLEKLIKFHIKSSQKSLGILRIIGEKNFS